MNSRKKCLHTTTVTDDNKEKMYRPKHNVSINNIYIPYLYQNTPSLNINQNNYNHKIKDLIKNL